jgi:hypothetical protein
VANCLVERRLPVGRLADGKEFDSSVKRGKPFFFNVGARDVILGWDLGVATMSKGEVCLVSFSMLGALNFALQSVRTCCVHVHWFNVSLFMIV